MTRHNLSVKIWCYLRERSEEHGEEKHVVTRASDGVRKHGARISGRSKRTVGVVGTEAKEGQSSI
jgi:hypothetical protein